MPKYRFIIKGTIETEDAQDARDWLNEAFENIDYGNLQWWFEEVTELP